MANHEPRLIGSSCFGKEGPDVLVRLVDDAGRPVPPGADGELLVRHAGPDPRFGFFSGYLKDPAASRQAWEGGWFHTGDIVRRNEKATLHFVDRKKNVIRRSGENISAVAGEHVMLHPPTFKAVAVAAGPQRLPGPELQP